MASSKVRVLGKVAALAVVGLGLPTLVACVIPAGTSRINSSHFAYPNSNVYPGDIVQGKARKLCGVLIFNWGSPDAILLNKAVNDALVQSADANMIINMEATSNVFMVPYLVTICSTKVTGTGAKMVVGEQDIGQRGAPAGGSGGMSAACVQCESQCEPLALQCRARPGEEPCFLAKVCTCECRQAAGGCGFEAAKLKQCVDDNLEKARQKGASGQ